MSAIRQRLTSGPGIWFGVVVVVAWGLTLLALATGQESLLSHDALLDRPTPPSPLDILLFFGAWQVMTAAMMLPSSLPMMHLFAQASRNQAHPRAALGVFVLAYFLVWTGFAVGALVVDSGIHAVVARWAWLDGHPQVIAGVLLAVAGVFQFSPLKEQCLQECRSPMGFLWRYYRRGLGGAWEVGIRHAVFCLGCCWALMLVMFGVGVGSLFWLTTLTGVMVIEKTVPVGRRIVPYVGVALLALGLLLISGAGSYPPIFSGNA